MLPFPISGTPTFLTLFLAQRSDCGTAERVESSNFYREHENFWSRLTSVLYIWPNYAS
jgi:hypothetical protein